MSLTAAISLSMAIFALTVSVISLVLHWVRRTATPEYSDLHSQIRALNNDFLDLADKVKHWRGRDNVRKARQGAEDKLLAESEGEAQADPKADLRRRAAARGLGIVSP